MNIADDLVKAYNDGYEQDKKEATETLQKEIARLASESVKREEMDEYDYYSEDDL